MTSPDHQINSHTNNDINSPGSAAKTPVYTRTARIYYRQISAMQKTPSLDVSGWKVTFEVLNAYKTRNMGWSYFDDTRCVKPVAFPTLDEAISLCRDLGGLTRLRLRGGVPPLQGNETEELR